MDYVMSFLPVILLIAGAWLTYKGIRRRAFGWPAASIVLAVIALIMGMGAYAELLMLVDGILIVLLLLF